MSNRYHSCFRPRWLAAALLAVPLWAQEIDRMPGEASYKFLKLPLSPRVVGLAGAGVALADEAGDLDLNPAAPATDSARLVLGKGYPFAQFGANSSHITWSIPYRAYRILVNARYLGFDDLRGFDENGQATAPYGAHTLKLQSGMAGTYGALDWGATLNYAQNSVASANYGTAMLNGGLRDRLLPGLYAGLSVINFDFWRSKARMAGNADPFPPTAVQAGLAYRRPLGRSFTGALAVDARTRNDEKLTWLAGAEAGWQEMIFVRVGYPLGEPDPGLGLGLGLRWSLFRFQYAYQGHDTFDVLDGGESLSPGHFFSLEISY